MAECFTGYNIVKMPPLTEAELNKLPLAGAEWLREQPEATPEETARWERFATRIWKVLADPTEQP